MPYVADPSSLQAQTTLDQVFAKMDEVAKTFRSVDAEPRADTRHGDRQRKRCRLPESSTTCAQGKSRGLSLKFPRPRVPQYLLIDKGRCSVLPAEAQAGSGGFDWGHQRTGRTVHGDRIRAIQSGFEKEFQVTLAGEEVVDGKKTAVLDLSRRPLWTGSDRSGCGWINRSGVSRANQSDRNRRRLCDLQVFKYQDE